jgi:uroporphyrinogen-III decarboxylase
MAETIAAPQILRDLLQGNVSARPLFVPIVFALGARVENLSARAFLGNPTKISNALRQIRGPLRSDGVSCYFDSLLEAEALGRTLEWTSENEPPTLRWPGAVEKGQLPSGLISPEDVIKRGRVPVALEVIKRLKALLREESLLAVGVTGPFTLAARLASVLGEQPLPRGDIPDAALELATAAVTHICKAFAEAGANLVFLREESLPAVDAAASEEWASMFTPIFNIIRFYEALPILQIGRVGTLSGNTDVILQLSRGCVVCPTLDAVRTLSAEERSGLAGAKLGVGLPVEALQLQAAGSDFDELLRQTLRELRPAIVTTENDVPPRTDLKRIAAVADIVRSV